MSFPFGGHPKLKEYIHWAEQEGCRTDYGVRAGPDGAPTEIIKITSPDSTRWVIIAGTGLSETLVPTTVGRFDRRLGMNSPFSKL